MIRELWKAYQDIRVLIVLDTIIVHHLVEHTTSSVACLLSNSVHSLSGKESSEGCLNVNDQVHFILCYLVLILEVIGLEVISRVYVAVAATG